MRGNLYLTGFMGAGKTTEGRLLSAMTGRTCVEMDERIEEREGCTIAEVFARRGEVYFRDAESEVLREIAAEEGRIVSCGGGTVLREENRRVLRESGVTVWLTAEAETICERVRDDLTRPVIAGRREPEEIRELMEERRAAYEAAAQICVRTDGRSPEEICREILARLAELHGVKE
ncbi:MAG: shikimate kinase [Lachnospiraceae bacterium]|nr:shikimate kinase [Lachnospiraceae bacterium]